MIDLTNPVEELLEAGLTPGRTNMPHPVVLDCDLSKGTVILQKSCQNTFISKGVNCSMLKSYSLALRHPTIEEL